MKAKLVIFDLDGTLADTSPGIFSCARESMMDLGLDPSAPREKIGKFVGPPLEEGFHVVYDLDASLIPRAVECYRKHYREHGVFQADLYPGIKEVLETLHKRGCLLAVGTLKNEVAARTMLSHQGIASLFDTIQGDREKGGRSKADILRLAMDALSVSPSDTVLVGDTPHDWKGANEADVRFIAVTYGFGFLPGYGDADAVIASPLELLDVIS